MFTAADCGSCGDVGCVMWSALSYYAAATHIPSSSSHVVFVVVVVTVVTVVLLMKKNLWLFGQKRKDSHSIVRKNVIGCLIVGCVGVFRMSVGHI